MDKVGENARRAADMLAFSEFWDYVWPHAESADPGRRSGSPRDLALLSGWFDAACRLAGSGK
jgi:hypothetical protein